MIAATASKSEVSENDQMVFVKHEDKKTSVYDMLSQQDPNSVALYGACSIEGRTNDPLLSVTFGMIAKAIQNSANLFAQNITPGRTLTSLNCGSSCPVVAYVAPAGIASALSFLVLGAQATLIPLSVNLSRDEIHESLMYVTDIVLVDEDELMPSFVETIREEREKLIENAYTTIHIHNALSYDDMLDRSQPCMMFENNASVFVEQRGLEDDSKSSEPALEHHVSRSEDVVMLLRTSGTTGKSKLVPLLNGSVVANGMIIAESLGLASTDVALNCMPLFHIGGLSANILAPLSVGSATICLPSFNAVEFVSILEGGKDSYKPPTLVKNKEAMPVSTPAFPGAATDARPQRTDLRRAASIASKKRSQTEEGGGAKTGRLSRYSSYWAVSNDLEASRNPEVSEGSEGQHAAFQAQMQKQKSIVVRSDTCVVKPTWYHAVPTMHAAICDYIVAADKEEDMRVMHTLRFIRTGAANLPASVGARLSEIFAVNIVSTYSMTEQMPICQVPKNTDFFAKPGTVGKPVGGTLGIFDKNDGSLLSMMSADHLKNFANQEPLVGEVCISGPYVTGGYINNPDANAASFFEFNGKSFFKTGDVGYLDRDGFLFLTGRSKELIKRGGEQVSPFEVEETVVKAFPQVKTCLCFGVPSTLWGEQVGLVMVMTSDDEYDKLSKKTKPQLTFYLKNILKDNSDLHVAKYPEHVILVRDENSLPKNAAGKFVRIGLAEKLNVTDSSTHVDNEEHPIVVSNAIKGVMFVLAFAVCWNHLYTSKSESDSARVWFFHEAMFFWIGGFTLSRSNLSFEKKGSWKAFYTRTYSMLLPLYWFSLLLCIIFFVAGCNPGNYVDSFEYGRQVTSPNGTNQSNDSCQATPFALNWGGSFVISVIVYFLNLQTWIFVSPVSWFLHWYSWFFSVYFFQVLLFPWLQDSMTPKYGELGNTKMEALEDRTVKKAAILNNVAFWMGMWLIITVLMAIIFFVLRETYSVEVINWWVLGIYQLPLRWTPSFALGVAGWHYFRLSHAGGGRTKHRYQIGYATDCLSVLFLVGLIIFWTSPEDVIITGWAADDNYDLTGAWTYHHLLAARFWQMFLAQIAMPLSCFWTYGMAVGEGYSAKIMANNFLVAWLAPAGYGMFLFQQPIGQLYFLITRPGSIWMTPKIILWFSPIPLPVPFWEFWPVIVIVILFSIFVVPYITILVTPVTLFILSLSEEEHGDYSELDGLTKSQIVHHAVEMITGIEECTDDMEFAFILGSLDAVLLVAELNHHSELLEQEVKIADIIGSKTIGDLTDLVEKRSITNAGVLQNIAPIMDVVSRKIIRQQTERIDVSM